MNWDTVYEGVIWRVQHAVHPSGKMFEKSVRSPGSRLIIVNDARVLLSREKRHEIAGKIDYRLPGGKVFDTSQEYVTFLNEQKDILEASKASIAKEALEEVGLVVEPRSLRYVGTDVLGATCEWDLIYWACDGFVEHSYGAQYHGTEGDEIDGLIWVSFDEAQELALDPDSFSESRSARMLLSYLKDLS